MSKIIEKGIAELTESRKDWICPIKWITVFCVKPSRN